MIVVGYLADILIHLTDDAVPLVMMKPLHHEWHYQGIAGYGKESAELADFSSKTHRPAREMKSPVVLYETKDISGVIGSMQQYFVSSAISCHHRGIRKPASAICFRLCAGKKMMK